MYFSQINNLYTQREHFIYESSKKGTFMQEQPFKQESKTVNFSLLQKFCHNINSSQNIDLEKVDVSEWKNILLIMIINTPMVRNRLLVSLYYSYMLFHFNPYVKHSSGRHLISDREYISTV